MSPGQAVRAAARRLPRHHRRHGDGCVPRTSARPTSPSSTFTATGSRARSDGCRCKCSGCSDVDGIALAHHLGRALQLTNILRDLDEDAGARPALSAEGKLAQAGISSTIRAGAREPRAAEGLRAAGRARAVAFCTRPTTSCAAIRASIVRAPRIMGKVYRGILDLLPSAGFSAPRKPVRVGTLRQARHPPALRVHLMQRTIHVIGAGVSGLAAAVRLANAGQSRRTCTRQPSRPAAAAAPI